MKHEHARTLIDRQFESGALSTDEWDALRSHLRECDACRAHYDRHGALEAGLAGGRVMNAARRERMAARQEPRGRGNVLRFPARWPVMVPILALAASVAVFVALPSDPGLVPRGSGEGAASYVSAFYERGDGQAVALADRLPRGAPLLFTYTNGTKSAYAWLAIVGLDAKGRAHWYYPEYVSADQADVESVPVRRGAADTPLPDRVFAEHAVGRLEICALFSEAPLDVKAVDVALEATRTWPEDGVQRECQTTMVTDE